MKSEQEIIFSQIDKDIMNCDLIIWIDLTDLSQERVKRYCKGDTIIMDEQEERATDLR